tara:strand:- start:361 stop:1053 length:693 start_codon:yes stop_codon:yes gene_type:complete
MNQKKDVEKKEEKVYQELKKFQKSPEEDDYLIYYFYRKISRPISTLMIIIGLNTFIASLFTFISDIIAMLLIYTNHFVLAAIFVIFAYVFDCCDGEIARYDKSRGKMKNDRMYGAYLDEVLGVLGFFGIILFLAYSLNQPILGILAGLGLLMVNFSCYVAKDIFPKKAEVAKKLEKKMFGNLKGRIGFSGGLQRIIIAFAILFHSTFLLLIFTILINVFWILKFWVYRKQ